MTSEKLFEMTNRKLTALINRAAKKSSREAAKMETGLAEDTPVTVHCYGQAEYWKSRYLAFHFYFIGAQSCEGAESERYWTICGALLTDETVASDGEPLREPGRKAS